ncbi:hypothetical protein Tco_0391212 [Tanacetum coccineum]
MVACPGVAVGPINPRETCGDQYGPVRPSIHVKNQRTVPYKPGGLEMKPESDVCALSITIVAANQVVAAVYESDLSVRDA